MKFRGLVLGALCVLSSVSLLWADEFSISQSLTDRAQRVLDGVFGKGNLVAIVDVAASNPSYQVKYTKQSQAAVTAQKSGGGDRMQILPGYPVIKNLAPENMKQLPFDSVTSYTQAAIRQITVTVLASQDFPRGQYGKVEALLTQVLSLKPNRDRVNFSPQRFQAANPERAGGVVAALGGKMGGATGSGLQGWHMMVLAGILIVFIGVYVWMSREQQKTFAALVKQMGGGKGGSGGGNMEAANVSVAPSISSVQKDKGGNMSGEMRMSESSIKRYFDFVTEGSVEKLIFILKREKMGVENLAVLVPCLEPHLAARVLKELDSQTQAMIVSNMTDPRMYNKAMIEKFEAQLRSAMECLIGGQGVASEVLGHVPESDRKQILSVLQQGNAQAYQRLRPLVVLFEDLARLDDTELKYLLGVVARDTVFTALVGMDEDIVSRFRQNMPTGIRNMFSEFFELRAAALTAVAIEVAREQVLDVALQLEAEGKLSLTAKLQS